MYNNKFDRKQSTDKFYGNYRGVVVSNEDPINSGRCQINVFSVFDGVNDSDLPWAQFADPFMGGASDVGGYIVPDVGNHVWVFFENGDFMKPVYFAGAPAKPHGPSEKSVGPDNLIIKTKKSIIEIDDEGERINITTTGDFDISVDGDVNLEATNVDVQSTTATVVAPTIDITGTINMTGVIDVTGDVVINGIPFSTHKHPNGSPNTGTPI